jgi:chromate reductase
MTIPNERISDKLHEPVRFLVFSASLREASLNSQLARLAARVIEQHGGKVDLAAMADFDVPSYDQDTHDAGGFPPGAEEFHRRLEANDAFVIASPEYNASMPGLLKNARDSIAQSTRSFIAAGAGCTFGISNIAYNNCQVTDA